jgi:hypothetical protein
MPQDASSLGEVPFLRALFLGDPKVGKTCTLILTALDLGPGYVIACATREHLRTAQLLSRGKPHSFQFDVVKGPEDMEAAIKSARQGVRDGAYNWVFVDDLNLYVLGLEQALEAKAKTKYELYQRLRQMSLNVVLRLFDLKCHVFACSHYFEVGDGEIDGQAPKKGKGIVPLMPGQSRQMIPASFNQVIWMRRNKDDKRTFVLHQEGVWGLGSQGLPDGAMEIEASIPALIALLAKAGELEPTVSGVAHLASSYTSYFK